MFYSKVFSQQRAINAGMQYRFQKGLDPRISIQDALGVPIVMVEYINRPYQFTAAHGSVLHGHKLKIMSVTRIKRRIRDQEMQPRTKNTARATRAPRSGF